MTLEQLKNKSDELIQAIRDYTQEKNFDSVELEIVLDDLLCKLPRDMIYIEWFDRSQIEDMANSQLNNEDASEDLVDACIYDLWSSNDSLMTGDDLYERIADTIREQHYKGEQRTCDFCGCELHDNEYDNDGKTIMCKTCQESGKFGHYDNNKGDNNDD